VVLILLPAIAFASPPDQLWIAGIYDGAAGDDVVTFVCEAVATEAASLPSVHPFPPSSEILTTSRHRLQLLSYRIHAAPSSRYPKSQQEKPRP